MMPLALLKTFIMNIHCQLYQGCFFNFDFKKIIDFYNNIAEIFRRFILCFFLKITEFKEVRHSLNNML